MKATGRVVLMSIAAAASLSNASCLPSDPGWHYHAPEGKPISNNGLRYELPAESGIQPRIYGSVFAGTLSIELDIRNMGAERIEVDLTSLSVHDLRGRSLDRRAAVQNDTRCGGETKGARCILAAGQSCRLSDIFQVRPLTRRLIFLQQPNPDLKELWVSIAPVRREEVETRLQIELVWDQSS